MADAQFEEIVQSVWRDDMNRVIRGHIYADACRKLGPRRNAVVERPQWRNNPCAGGIEPAMDVGLIRDFPVQTGHRRAKASFEFIVRILGRLSVEVNYVDVRWCARAETVQRVPDQVPDHPRTDAPREKVERPDTSQSRHQLIGGCDQPNERFGVLQCGLRSSCGLRLSSFC